MNETRWKQEGSKSSLWDSTRLWKNSSKSWVNTASVKKQLLLLVVKAVTPPKSGRSGKTQKPRRAKKATKISQSSRPIPLAADETVIKEWEDRMERAATTASSLEAEQDSGNINRTQSMTTLNDSLPQGTGSGSGPRVNTLGSGEDNMKLKELMELLLVHAAKLKLTAVRHKLLLPGITYYCWIQAQVDKKKKVIITETSVRSDLKLEDAEGIDCVPTATIFAKLERMGTMTSVIIYLATNQKFNFSKYIFDNMMKNLEGGVKFLMYPRFMQVFLDNQVKGMTKHKGIYVTPSHTKKVFANMKRPGKDFSGKVTPLFSTMMVRASEDMGEDSAAPTDSHSAPIITRPSSSKPQKKKSQRKQRKDNGPTEPIPDEATNKEHISTPSYDPPQSEKAKTAQAKEIASLKKRVKQLEKRRKLRTLGLKRLRKVGSASRVESSNDVSLGAQEDASKQGRKIANLDADAEVTLIDETQGRIDEDLMFDTSVLNGDEVFEEPIVNTAPTTSLIPVSAANLVTTAGEVVTTASIDVTTASSPTTTIDELTLAQTLIKIKAAKPKAVTTTVITITPTSTRPKTKGIVFHDQEEQAHASTLIVSLAQPSSKYKGKGKMVEPEPGKKTGRKTQIQLNKELAFKMHAEEQAELEKMQRERVAQEEASRAAVIEELDSI
ncbi:hypothetical protein Tco_1167392 [Tanacetum coccineum]